MLHNSFPKRRTLHRSIMLTQQDNRMERTVRSFSSNISIQQKLPQNLIKIYQRTQQNTGITIPSIQLKSNRFIVKCEAYTNLMKKLNEKRHSLPVTSKVLTESSDGSFIALRQYYNSKYQLTGGFNQKNIIEQPLKQIKIKPWKLKQEYEF
ncbi:hypothetical protein pb186bvf_001558 [Paramecium bursaria]